MLKDKDRIFQNLYNDSDCSIESSKKRGDWLNTKEIISKGKEWIINEIKSSELSYLSHPVEFVRNLLATSGGAEWTFMVCSSEVRGRRHYISRHFTLTQ